MPGITAHIRCTRPKRPACAFAATALAALLAGCGGGGSSSSSPSTTATTTASTASHAASAASTAGVSTKSLPGVGVVLVNANGRTLYVFTPDAHAKATCTGTCALSWPPAKLSGAAKPTASGQANAALLGSDPDPEGGRVVTYAGWPLYTYVADSAPGQDTGEGLETNGGLWYAIAPSGKPVVPR